MAIVFPTLALMGALTLATQSGIAAAAGASREGGVAGEIPPGPTRTVKERLSSKASDDQRVDNCKVPPDLRGPTPRPDDCRHGTSTAPTQ